MIPRHQTESPILYGINPTLEALKAKPSLLDKILMVEGKRNPALQGIEHLARGKKVPLQSHPRDFLTQLAGTGHHQGVIGFLKGLPYASEEEFWQSLRAQPPPAQVLILDGLEDPQNLGSLIRTAEVCGISGVIIPKDRAVGLTPAVIRASAGAAVHVPVVRVTNLANTLDDLKREGFWIVGADARGGKSLYDMKFDMNLGVVIGSEGKGIRPLILSKCDFLISIPMKGKISSLNAAVAGAVILFEILRQQLTSKNSRSGGLSSRGRAEDPPLS